MKSITHHHGIGCNDGITIEADDASKTPGGGHRVYRAYYTERRERASAATIMVDHCVEIPMQNGDPAAVGNNGLTIEALLSIVAEQLIGFQSGQWACAQNDDALTNVMRAMACLRHRSDHGPIAIDDPQDYLAGNPTSDHARDNAIADLEDLPHIGPVRAAYLHDEHGVYHRWDLLGMGAEFLAESVDGIDREMAEEVMAAIAASREELEEDTDPEQSEQAERDED